MSRSAAVSVDLARPRSGGPDLLMERSGLGSNPFEVRDPLVHLGELGAGLGLQARVRLGAVSVSAGVDETGHLVQGESESLGSLDDAQGRHCRFRIQAVSARTTHRLLDQAATLVIPQRLLIHPGSGRDLTRAQSVGNAPSTRVASARRTRAASTSALAGGTRTSMTTIAAPEVCTSNVRKEQHELSRAVRSRAHAARLAASTRASSSRACISLTYTARVTQCAKSESNSATPSG